MKRFINLGSQLYLDDETKSFSFFCTIKNKFETFSGCQTWDSISEFKEDFDGEDIERYLSLITEETK